MKYIRLTILVLCVSVSVKLSAQSLQSPYSNYGLGEYMFSGLSHNMGMGNVGIGTPSHWNINLLNPAHLTYNPLSSFQVGVNGDFRQYNSSNNQDNSASASLRFLSMSVPVVNRRWSTAFALLPLSTVKYNTFNTDSLDYGESVLTQNLGEGGLTQFVWANGIRVYKNLNIGFKGAFVFGSIDQKSNIFLVGDSVTSSYIITYNENTVYTDFLFTVSAAYRQKISDTRYLNFGVVYDFSQSITGTQERTIVRKNLSGINLQVPTVLSEGVKATESLPDKLGVGLSYEVFGKLKLGVDYTMNNWADVNSGSPTAYRNTSDLAAGIEIIPDVRSVNSYFKRVNYRAGFSLKQLPYLVNGTEINDFGINFGASFPTNGFSSLDAVVKFGSRGTTQNNLIRENYFQFVIGATINDKWFIKRRYD